MHASQHVSPLSRRAFVAAGALACAALAAPSWALAEQPAETPAYPITLTLYDGDGTAYEQTFEEAPATVVTLTDSAAEILCRLGLADKIVGTVTPEAPMPEDIADDYAAIEQLGDKKTLSREVIVGAAPGLIVGRAATFTAEGQTDAKSYNDLGILLYTQLASAAQGEPSLRGIIDDVKNLAAIFGVTDQAADYIAELEGRLTAIEERVAEAADQAEEPQTVLIMTNFKDGTFGTFGGATGASLQFNLIEAMGAEMASRESASGLTYENLIVADPDVILYITAERNTETDASVLETLYAEPSIADVPAIANERVVMIPYAEFMDPSPRVFDSAEKILEVLYPAE